ncbi:MAG: tetratricopeptide repeat protein [Candidatus Aureabacteria bacterium]|nr:tetratricopeptide repeat protein [Candidatus Auribacterota bacterium]
MYLKEGKLDDALRELSKGFGPPTRERSLRAARALTEAYLKRGERDKSVALCNAILGTGAAAVEEYNSLAVAYQQMGKLDAAAGVAEKGVAAFPASAELHNNLATIYALRTEYARAAQEYQRAVELKPGLAEAYLDMGIIYNEYLKRPEKAAEAFRSYVVLKPEGKKRPDIAELLGSGAAER